MEQLTYTFSIIIHNLINKTFEFFSIYLYSISIILLFFILSYVFRHSFANFVINSICKLINKTKISIEKSSLDFSKKPLRIIFVSSVMFFTIMSQSSITKNIPLLLPYLLKLYRIIILLSIMNFIYAAIPVSINAFEKHSHPDTTIIHNTIVIFFTKITKVIIIVLSFLIILGEFGVNINGLITGVGLGGLTFALAAQDTASNIFGGLVIISDKPFAVGDWIQTSSIEGVVEDITFRSTRIRTFDDALTIVPNSTLASASITNWSKMNKRKIKFLIGLCYNTRPSQIKKILKDIQAALLKHEDVIDDSILVKLDEFGDSSFDILVTFFARQTSLPELKRVREEINFDIIDIVYNNESKFALPSTSVYLEN